MPNGISSARGLATPNHRGRRRSLNVREVLNGIATCCGLAPLEGVTDLALSLDAPSLRSEAVSVSD